MPEALTKPAGSKTTQNIQVNVSEVKKGTRYRGNITINSTVFTFTLQLPFSFAMMYEKESSGDLTPEGLLRTTNIEVNVGGKPIELTEKEKAVFFFLGGMPACRLFNQTPYEEEREESICYLMNTLTKAFALSPSEYSLKQTIAVILDDADIQGLLRKANQQSCNNQKAL